MIFFYSFTKDKTIFTWILIFSGFPYQPFDRKFRI